MAKKKSKAKMMYKTRKTVSHRDWGKDPDVPWDVIPAGRVVEAETFSHLNYKDINRLVDSGTLEIITVEDEEPKVIEEDSNDG